MRIILFTLLLCFSGVFAWSQTESEEEKISVRVIFLDRVYEHALGYVVKYGKLTPYRNEVVLPLKWFGSTYKAIAKLHYDKGAGLPFLIIHFRNGVIVSIDLYIPENPFHPSRDTLRTRNNTRELFNVNVEDATF